MSLAITSDQTDLRDTTRRFLAATTPITRVRETMTSPTAFDEVLWRQLTQDLGLPGLAVPEEDGGAGLSLQDLSYVAEECGRVLAPGPLISTCGLAVPLLLASGDEEARRTWLPRLVSGEIGTVAWQQLPSRDWKLRPSVVKAVPNPNSARRWYLTGELSPVLDGGVADILFVIADTDNGQAVVAVDGTEVGVTRNILPNFDQTRGLGRVSLHSAPGTLVGHVGQGAELLAATLDVAAVLLAAEMIGGAQACLDMSVAYAKVRHQFGRPIGSFQAIKHKCAEVLVDIEGARAAARYAAWCAVEDPATLPTAATVAKASAAKAFFRAAAENVQIHGGIGATWEHDAHLYLKRAQASQSMFGNVGADRRRLADLIGI
ncbi:acyl-CoA dehydrogenase family protein [Brevibacterium yomogidense]|uniref:acyl-CoA dehydrogenase family protein n=1 Tax=Brevibacterium yomogidense TaxID=946573 RepID=UPI0018DFCC0F|nr:acyl-CoA dehydrogenase family protein [Brevibacterium yomogidense]